MHNHSENDPRGAPLPSWPLDEQASGGPPPPHQLPSCLPASPLSSPSSPSKASSSWGRQRERERETDREKACSLTRWQPFIVKRRAVLRQTTMSAQSRHDLLLWRGSLGAREGDGANPGGLSVGLSAGWDSEGWITLHSLKKNDSLPWVEWVGTTPRGSR